MESHPDRPDDDDGVRTRRAFLARLTATTLAPLALGACARREGDAGEQEPIATKTEKAVETQTRAAEATSTGPEIPRSEPTIRVRVLSVGDREKPLRIGEKGEWIELRSLPGEDEAGDESGSGGTPAFALYHAPLTITVNRAGWSIVDARGYRPRAFGMNPLELRAVSVDGAAPHLALIRVGEREYPGAIRLVGRGEKSSDGYYVVNHVALESYLPGVLEKELYSHWQLHTFAAQAIAARSYACAERSYRAHRPYDVTNTTSSQMYIGSAAHERAIEAVKMTRGMVLAHAGGLVPAYYSSCCGGVAAVALDAISTHPVNDIPPLRGRSGRDVCTGAELFSWTIERSTRDVSKRLGEWGSKNKNDGLAGLRSLDAIEVSAVNAHGRPTEFTISAKGEMVASLDAETLRRAVDYSGRGLGEPRKRLWSSNVRVTVEGRTVRFEGAGHGHGVGMCQHGAEALAREGRSYESILGWYYPDARVLRGYA